MTTIVSIDSVFSGRADCKEREDGMLYLLCVSPDGHIEVDTFDYGTDRERYAETLDLGAYTAVINVDGCFSFVDLPD
jgi:hypothetical protein